MIQYLNSATKFIATCENTYYFAKFTNRVSISYDMSKRINRKGIKVRNLDSEENDLRLVYWNNDLLINHLQTDNFLLLSSLMFCKQVELEPWEFIKLDGVIQINNTKLTSSPTADFYKVSPRRVRICIEEYLQYQNRATTRGRTVWYVIVIFGFVTLLLW